MKPTFLLPAVHGSTALNQAGHHDAKRNRPKEIGEEDENTDEPGTVHHRCRIVDYRVAGSDYRPFAPTRRQKLQTYQCARHISQDER